MVGDVSKCLMMLVRWLIWCYFILKRIFIFVLFFVFALTADSDGDF